MNKSVMRLLQVCLGITVIQTIANTFVLAQDVSVSMNATSIALNEVFQITATVENDRIKEYSNFPEIEGFRKMGTSSSTSTNIINGKASMSQSITQNYSPTKQGNFILKPFQMTINGKTIQLRGATITVTAPVQRQVYDPFASFFGMPNNQPQEFIDVKEDAFFAVTTNKNSVYVGEGFTMTIAFYVSMKNRANMEFYNISEQLTDILKKVKPANCWEENFGIDQIVPEYVTLKGQQYKQFKIYQATFFPLNTQSIVLPIVGLKMIKYKVAKNPSFFGQNQQEDFKTFYSTEKRIQVKELPPHPLKEVVNVGSYRLQEEIADRKAETGKSIKYTFKIQGEGNISAIKEPTISKTTHFEVYPPNVSQNVNRANAAVFGTKSFQYFIEPQEPGDYPLKDYIQWIYFNTETHKYDTLASEIVLQITGESKKDASIASNDIGGFYDTFADSQANTLQNITKTDWAKIFLNTSLSVLFITGLLLLFRKKNTNEEV